MPLKNRAVQIPGGLKFMQSETGWIPDRFSSFDSIVEQVINHRNGNPWLTEKNGWSTDRATVEMEVDNYNTRFCQQMGGQWLAYIEGGPDLSVPFGPTPRLSQLGRLAVVAGGAKVLVEWIKDATEAVPHELSNQRAKTCVECPMNAKGDWTRFFTKPVSIAIQAELERRLDMKLSTDHDEQLGICDACLCPMRLKVHAPLGLITKHISQESRQKLHPSCWITIEEKNQNAQKQE